MIGEKLKQLRKDRNLTLQELADNLNNRYQDKNKSINFSKGKLSKWENEKEQPYLSSARLVADYFDVSVDYLIGRKTEEQTNDINPIYNQLEKDRQRKVYDYANHQLKQQNGELNNHNDILIAAHANDNLTEEDQQQINDFITKILNEKQK